MKRPIAIDLFAGVGGMSLGFEQAGFDVKIAVEIDPIHCATHEYNFPNTKVICQSIRDFYPFSVDQPDVIVGGPPCQGFSIGGYRNPRDKRNDLVLEFLRVVKLLQPKYFVMENVPGILSNYDYLAKILNSGKQIGYLIQYQVLKASDYGVSQDRDRVFFVGSREDQNIFNYPLPTTTTDPQCILFPKTKTIGDVLKGLPTIEDYDFLYQQDYLEWQIQADDNHYGYDRNYPQVLTGCARTNHSDIVMKRFANTLPGEKEAISRFPRLNSNSYSPTLRAGTGRERGSHTAPRPIHPSIARCITVREGARLHSYPDWFCFHSTIANGFRQIGNSVCPNVAQAIATSILKSLRVTPSKPDTILELGNRDLLSLTMTQACQYYGINENTIPKRIKKVS